MNYQNEVTKIIGLSLNKTNKPEDILFFSGAGISVPPPANFPIGNALHRMILEHGEKFSGADTEKLSSELVFEETISRLSNIYRNNNETFLHVLSSIFGVQKTNLPDTIRSGTLNHKPNDYHYYFNWHIKNNGAHFTVNIDQFIESISEIFQLYTKSSIVENETITLNTPLEGYLLKIHGDVNKDEWLKQGYLYENVQAFNNSFKKLLDEKIHKTKFVIFIGYGGVDKYDITPYFEEKSNSHFHNTSALWIQYSDNEEPKKTEKITYAMHLILSKFKSNLVLETSKPELILNSLFTSSPTICNTKMDNDKNGKEIERFMEYNFKSLNN